MERKYYKIISIIFIIIIFVMLASLDIPEKIRNYQAFISNGNKLEGSCYSGDGTTYYIKTDSLNVRSTPEVNDDNIIDELTKCSVVKVYCSNEIGDTKWGKISKVSDKWISLDNSYVSTNKPSACTSTVTTKTETISFSLSDLTITPEEGYEKLYANKIGTISFDVENINNVSLSDEDLVNIKIFKNSRDVTNDFEIEKEFNAKEDYYMDSVNVLVKMKESANYSVSAYTIKVIIGGANSSKTFNIVDEYFDYNATIDLTTTYADNPINKENKWIISIQDKTDNVSINKFSVDIKKDDSTYNSNFNISKSGTRIEIKNKTGKDTRPKPGKYEVSIKYKIGENEKEDKFEIELGLIKFEKSQESYKLNPYIRTYTDVSYDININKITETNVTYVDNNDNNKTYTKTKKEFGELHPQTNLGIVNYNKHTDNNSAYFGYLVYISGNYEILRKVNDILYYYDNTSDNLKQINVNSLGDLSDGYLALTNDSAYSFLSNGYLTYNSKGIIQKETINLDPHTSDQISATVGGEFKIVYRYEGTFSNDFNENDYTYVIENIENIDNPFEVNESDGFTLNLTVTNNKLTYIIKYNNTSLNYIGNYVVKIKYKDAEEFEIPFNLWGNEDDFDYYVGSHVDNLTNYNLPDDYRFPPANKKIPYYLKFYLFSPDGPMNNVNSNMINVNIFDKRIDVDSDNNKYFYDQVDYELEVSSYNKTTNEIKYKVTIDGVTSGDITQSVNEFRNNYNDVYKLLDNYEYDENGEITTDNYPIHITNFSSKFNTDTNTMDMYVNYYLDGEPKEPGYTQEINLFKLTYPEMYGYLITRFTFDVNGNIIKNKFMGSYRENIEMATPLSLEARNVTNQFEMVYTKNRNDAEHAVTFYPKKEVNVGEYYVYANYGARESIGHINNQTDSLISKELYPEMWEQNNYFTILTYEEPYYGIDIDEPKYSNTVNDKEVMYNNVESSVLFEFNAIDIHDYSKFTYAVEKYNGSSWADVSNDFIFAKSRDDEGNKVLGTNTGDGETLKEYNEFVKLTTKNNATPNSQYRLKINYTNNSSSTTEYKEFTIEKKFYGILLAEETMDPILYYVNHNDTNSINLKGLFISNVNNISVNIENLTYDEEYILDKNNKEFKKTNQTKVFKYTYEVDNDYYDDENTLLYKFKLTNVKDSLLPGRFKITFTYQENNDEESKSEVTYEFVINEASYDYNVLNPIAYVDQNEMKVTLDIETNYIDYDDLDYLTFKVKRWNKYIGGYQDVSTDDADVKMFESVNAIWNPIVLDSYNQGGKLELLIDRDKVIIENSNLNLSGDYIIVGKYKDDDEIALYELDLKSLFDWKVAKNNEIKYHGVYNYIDSLTGNPKTLELNEFYNTVNNTIVEVPITTPHNEALSWYINKECLPSNGNDTCNINPDEFQNYKDYFEEVENSKTNFKIKYKGNQKLPHGKYALILYYSANDYKIREINVHGDFAYISFGENLIYSDITLEDNSSKIVKGLFKNRNGHIYIPVSVIGVNYDQVNVSITDNEGRGNYKNILTFDENKFINDHVLDITYDSRNEANALNNYQITVSYRTNEGEDISDHLTVKMNNYYYNYVIEDPTYIPDPMTPDIDSRAIFRVDTEEIPYVAKGPNNIDYLSKKYDFARLAKVYNEDGEDVTNKFSIFATNSNSDTSFKINLAVIKQDLEEGNYTLKLEYDLNGYYLTKSKDFYVGDYRHSLTLGDVEVITTTYDDHIHKNVGGTFKIPYSSKGEVASGLIDIRVIKDDVNYDDYFDINVLSDYLVLDYDASPELESGKYLVMVTYEDEVQIKEITIYGYFKNINISNMYTPYDVINVDVDNQYYTFDVDTSEIAGEILTLQAKIVNREKEDVTSSFEVINNLTTSDNNYRINIIPYRAKIDTYYICLYVLDEFGDPNYSNSLAFTIDGTNTKVKILNDSYLKQKINYNNDLDSIYDKDGALGYYHFTTTYDTTEGYNIQILSNNKVIKTITPTITKNADNSYVATFETGGIEEGNYDVALSINSIPYDLLPINVSRYINATKVTMLINNSLSSNNLTLYQGQTYKVGYKVEPTNATNIKFNYTSTSSSVASFNNGNLITSGSGTSVIKISNGEVEQVINLTVKQKLASNKYTVNTSDYTIFVPAMTGKSLSKSTFINSLEGLISGYQILDANNKNITSSVSYIGTNMSIKNGNETYKIIVIGDVNGDGKINVADTSMIFQHVRNKKKITNKYILKAADVNKDSKVNVGDVGKEFQFVRNKISRI